MPTNWADDVEEEVAAGTHDVNGPPPVEEFPSLAQAAKQPPKPPAKKKTGKKLTMAEIMAMAETPAPRAAFGSGSRRDGPPTDRELLMSLPTASRGKVEGEEGPPGLGGGFGGYGGDRAGAGGFGARRDDRREGGRERGGDRDGDREGGFGPGPSRADEVDDWGSTRTFQASAGGGGGFGGGRGGGGGFRDRDQPREPRAYGAADEVADWGSTRKYEPSAQDDRRGGYGGPGGFRDAARDGGPRRFDGPPRPSDRADAEDQWSRGREFQQSDRPGSRGTSGSRNFGFGGDRDVPRSAADNEDRWARRQQEQADVPAPAATAQAERPRLKLAPRTKPVEAPPAPTLAPVEEAPTAPAAPPSVWAAKPRPAAANPFGEARPREEVLKEKGIDPTQQEAQELPPPAPATQQPSAAAPAAPQPEASQPAQQPSSFVSIESKEEVELKDSIAEMHRELEALKEEEHADEDEQAEIQAAIEQATTKLGELRIEREAMEAKAREEAAQAELEGGSWVPAKVSSKAAVKAEAPAVAPANGAASPAAAPAVSGDRRSGGGRGGAGGRSSETGTGQGMSDSRPAPRGVAAGAPNVERKW